MSRRALGSWGRLGHYREARPADAVPIDAIDIEGNRRTQASTVLDLLPRVPPATYTPRELDELERRLNNLEIFDQVTVARVGRRLAISLREKWTLIPTIEFSTGKTFEDARFLVGATEYNLLGTANQLTLNLFREERGFGASLGYSEHMFRRRRWTFGGEAFGASANYRFENGSSWNAFRSGAELGFTSPPVLSDHFNVRVGGYYMFESTSDRVMTNVPAMAHAIAPLLSFVYNHYEFHDLVSSGVKAELGLTSGLLAPTASSFQPRHSVEFRTTGALPLAKYTVVMARVMGAVASLGSANHSFLVGSIDGVRGLDDTLYRSWVLGSGNLEFRQGLPVFQRWALQGVVFADGALFERITEDGKRGEGVLAASLGAGVRVVPTWLANVVVRADLAYLVAPIERPFLQLGLRQYF